MTIRQRRDNGESSIKGVGNMAEMHYFDIHIAEKYGVKCAVILQNLWHWIKKNQANDINYYDGNYWTYNSKKAFAELFPYMTERQIGYALQKLIDNGLIITGNYNKVAYDRTLWYAITEKGKSILQNCQTEKTTLLNQSDNSVQPIPYINAYINTTDDKEKEKKEIYKEKNDTLIGYDEILSFYVADADLRNLYCEYIKVRNSTEPHMTNEDLIEFIDKVTKLDPYDIERQKLIVDVATTNRMV